VLDATIGLSQGANFLLREIYPNHGRMVGKPGAGVWSRGDQVHLRLDGTSATVLELIPAPEPTSPLVLNAIATGVLRTSEGRAVLTGNQLAVAHIGGEYGSSEEIGVLLPGAIKIVNMTVNGHAVQATQKGNYVSAQVHFTGEPFRQAEEITLAPAQDGSLAGTFTVPQRVLKQLTVRKQAWPIPWTPDDYNTTWLAPERLLLFLQFADGSDAIPVSASLDDRPLKLEPAYSSIRIHAASFVGLYADLSTIAPDKPHKLALRLPAAVQDKLQGVFFDNVESQFTEEVVP
jgi:hypothetical protein